jgi:hypothetical protein
MKSPRRRITGQALQPLQVSSSPKACCEMEAQTDVIVVVL